ncbi:MAG: FIST signal transduction protein [Hyphomicrobiaceae bacterium]
MRTLSLSRKKDQGWVQARPVPDAIAAQLVLYFGSRAGLEDEAVYADLRSTFPSANIVGCSTGGQLLDDHVTDDTATAMALQFDATDVFVAREDMTPGFTSFQAGRRLGVALYDPALSNVLVLSDGLHVNGSELVRGLVAVLGKNVIITGGLAGDGAAFAKTIVAANGQPRSGQVAAIGFYGNKLVVGHGSAGGWNEFGPKRRITQSAGNKLIQLDDKPALDLYKLYLGDEANGLPGTALLYPLLVSDPVRPQHSLVRTVLSVDHDAGTMKFAGDIPEGWSAQLMRGYFDRLAEGAGHAAKASTPSVAAVHGECAAILVSCIGRRLLMGESIVDEIAAARRALGASVQCAGFYSYGEISPHAVSGCAELHNQTMTVTTLSEAA